jgi:hypothetical protein
LVGGLVGVMVWYVVWRVACALCGVVSRQSSVM